MIILLMGVSGVGKTTIGQTLAQQLGWHFADADDFHPAANVARMHAGIPLGDADRAPWLQSLHDAIVGWVAAGQSVVLACSALKQSYRQQLLTGPDVKLVFLHADFDLVSQRLEGRHGHYMNPGLLRSQFDTLESPQDAVSIDVSGTVPEIVAAIRAALGIETPMDSSSAIADLNTRFGIPGVAMVVAGKGGLARVVVSTPNAAGEMYLHGGHVTSWVPKDASEVLYCSPYSFWQDGRAIRGGVPICFPWFGDKADNPAAPAHGFVRTKAWKLGSIAVIGDDVSVSMFTESADDTRRWWPHDFRLVCRATFAIQLKLELIVSNIGATPFTFEEALHAYFRVGDAGGVSVDGLDSTDYIDKTDHLSRKTHHGELRFTAETDSVFLNTRHPLELVDPATRRRITLQKQNSLTTVVWNPWAKKSTSMSDLGEGQWKNFICVEASNVGDYAVQIAPGHQHVMSVKVQVASQ